jgi:hypothetical protein
MSKTTNRLRLRPRANAGKPAKIRRPFKSPLTSLWPHDGSKLARILTLLMRPEGAMLGELVHVTGWREHSVRAAMTNIIKRRLDLYVRTVKSQDGWRRYYVTKPRATNQSAETKDGNND